MSPLEYLIYPIVLACIPIWAIVCLYQINRRVDDIQTKLQELFVVVKVQKDFTIAAFKTENDKKDFTIAALNQRLKNIEEKK